ncbi:MAG: M24 family metallopeptidase [Candidatus Binatia bacterium]
MRTNQRLPKLSIQERDRRYRLIREHLKNAQVDGVITSGSNLFYLTNGLPGERYGFLPAAEHTPTVVINFRNLADISVQVLLDAQNWIQDIRGGLDATFIVERIKELGLESGTLGLAGLSFGGIDHAFYAQLQAACPLARLVDVSAIFHDVRTLKSEEEILMIDTANRIFDAAVERVQEVARPGVLGRQVLEEGIRAMWEAGGDMDSSFNFHFGKVPKQNPVLMQLCLSEEIQQGDIGTLTAHAEYGHYAGHSDHQISFGDPQPLHRDLFKAVLQVRDAVLSTVKEGVTHVDLVECYLKAVKETGFRASPHSQTHQYGIDVPEFPGPAFRAPDTSKEQLSKRLGLGFRGGNFELKTGMVYSISPTLLAVDGEDTMLAGTTLVVTPTGYRELGDRKVELVVCA